MRVLVCGGRHFTDYGRLRFVLNTLHGICEIDVVISGRCPTGADYLGEKWASTRRIPVAEFPADWDDITAPGAVLKKNRNGRLYNAVAGFTRNQRMIDEGCPDLVVAFPGGNGTADMVKRARAAGIRVVEIPHKASSRDMLKAVA